MSVLCQFFATTMEAKTISNQIFYCGLDIFAYAKVSIIVELCLSVIFNIVLLGAAVWQYGLWSFQTGYVKLERFLPKNQHTQRKFLNFENWTNREPQ